MKTAASVGLSDARHLRTFIEEYSDQVPAALLVYGGSEAYWLTDKILVVPWTDVL